MTTIQPGEFWIADIPFTDASGSKKRPILILWIDGQDVVVTAVTSVKPRTLTDVSLDDWQISGLKLPSTVRLSRLDCLEYSLLIFRLGLISQNDAQRLKQVWDLYVKPEF